MEQRTARNVPPSSVIPGSGMGNTPVETPMRGPDSNYSWELLAPHRKREVLGIVNGVKNKRRGQRIAWLFALILLLAVLAVVYFIVVK